MSSLTVMKLGKIYRAIKTTSLHTANGAAVYTLPQTDGSAGQFMKLMDCN